MIKGGLTLILSFPKAWFLSRIHQISVASSIALFRSFISYGLQHREVIASSASKTASVVAEQRALLVFLTRNRAFETSLRDDL